MIIGIDARLWNETGVGRYIRNLVWELSKIDKRNQYILFFKRKEFNTVSVPSKNFQKRLADIQWHTFSEQIFLPKILERDKLDLVHFPYYSVPFLYNKPFVVTIHDLIPLHFQTGKASTLPLPLYRLKLLGYKFIVSQAVKKAKKIITPSNASKKDVIDYLKIQPSKIEVIYEGVDKYLKNNKASDRFKNIFLYVGNAYPHKNLGTLLTSFKNARDKIKDNLKLVLVGKKDFFYKRLMDKARETGLENEVKFIGFATDKELSSLYNKSKALIIPSFIEGFGLPALEAMANNCLVLASDIPVLHEVGGDAAIYFNPKDPDDLTRKLLEVNYSLNKEKIKKGLERVKHFSWQKTAEETLRVYNSLMSSNVSRMNSNE